MNILITGCCGFIGSNFWNYYAKFLEGCSGRHKLIGIDKLTYAGNKNNMNLDLFRNSPAFTQFSTYSYITKKFFKGDICNRELIDFILEEYQIEIIINFAAETHVDNSIKNSSNFLESNITGVHTLLDSFKNHIMFNPIIFPKFIQISTDEVYGPALSESFIETDVLHPKNPYAATKAAAEHLALSYYNTFKLPVIITRSSNNFGPFQHTEKFIPKAVTNLLNKKPIELYGSGKQIRDWLYVGDNCNYIKEILYNGKIGEVYNIGADNLHKNIDVAKKIIKIFSKLNDTKLGLEKNIKFIQDRLGHDFKYNISSNKLHNILSIDPIKLDFNKKLENTVKWYIENPLFVDSLLRR